MARLCFLTERLLRGWGVDHVIHRLADGLGRRGHEVDVVCLRADRTYGDAAYRVRILDVPYHPVDTLEARVVARSGLILQRPYDLHVVALYPFYGVAAHHRLPFVYFEFGVVTPEGQPPALVPVLSRIRRDAPRYQMAARRVAVISRFLMHEQVNPGKHAETDVVYLGADSYGPPPSAAEAAGVRAELGLLPADEVVGYLGRIERNTYKGVDDLIAIVSALRARRPHSRLLLLGICADEAQRYFSGLPGVIVRPNVSADEIPLHLAAVDVVAHASRWEGFNLPLVEAQYHGRPVVAYRIGPHPEVVGPGGTLVETREEFVAALDQLFADPVLRRQRGEAARAFAARFTWAASVEAMAACVERALGPPSGSRG